MGQIDPRGDLSPGASATADVLIGGEDDDNFPQMCRTGQWHATLSLETSLGVVRYSPIAFPVSTTECSDSTPSGDPGVDPKTIHWSLFSHSGVRLGVSLQTASGDAPSMGTFPNGSAQPEFRAGATVRMQLYMDDLADQPVELRAGADAFRIFIRQAGKSDQVVTPAHTTAAGADQELIVSPHTWRNVQTIVLNDSYDLAPGDYQLLVGPRTVMGDAAGANAPASGWPYTEQAVTVDLLIKIIP
jgi:hypothetical protein